MEITQRLLTMGAEHGRTGKAMTPQGIVVHYVGNPGSTAEANRNWFEGGAGGARTSSHYIVGLGGEILRLIPEEERAQHAGKAYAAQYEAQAKLNNSMYIGIECCHPYVDGQFNVYTYASLIALCADICRRRQFNPFTDVFRHFDVTGKSCPLFYLKNPEAWARLQSDIAGYRAPSADVPQSVKIRMDGETITVPAENINDHWYISLEMLGGLQVMVADVLRSAGYTVTWDAVTATIIAEK